MSFEVQVQKDEEKQASEDFQQQKAGCCAFLSVEYYHPYFKVTEQNVLERIKATFMPLKSDFKEAVGANPDLYGPIWINATLILLIAASGNLVNLNTPDAKFNIDFVPWATTLLYAVTFGTPTLLTLLIKFLGSELSLFDTICLYGYSMSTLLPITIICTFGFGLVNWLLVVYGILNSSVFLLTNMRNEIDKLDIQKRYIIMGLVLVVQIILYLCFKIEFFTIYNSTSSAASTGIPAAANFTNATNVTNATITNP